MKELYAVEECLTWPPGYSAIYAPGLPKTTQATGEWNKISLFGYA